MILERVVFHFFRCVAPQTTLFFFDLHSVKTSYKKCHYDSGSFILQSIF